MSFNTNDTGNTAGAGVRWANHIWFHSPTPADFQVSNGVMNILGNSVSDSWAANMETVDSNGQGWCAEIRLFRSRHRKFPAGQGTWPAFWMFDANKPTNGSATGQEFDIIEGQGSVPRWIFRHHPQQHRRQRSVQHEQFHKRGHDHSRRVPSVRAAVGSEFAEYDLLLRWPRGERRTEIRHDRSESDDADPRQAVSAICSGQIEPNSSTPIPADMKVDYVRAYQFASQDPTAVQAQPVSTAAGNTDPTAVANALGVDRPALQPVRRPALRPVPQPVTATGFDNRLYEWLWQQRVRRHQQGQSHGIRRYVQR